MMKLTIDFPLAAPEEELTKTNKTNILAKSVSMIWGVGRRISQIETRADLRLFGESGENCRS
jgi:hypothetical protein